MHQNIAAMHDDAMARDVDEQQAQRSPAGMHTIEITATVTYCVDAHAPENDPAKAIEEASSATELPAGFECEIFNVTKAVVVDYSPDDPGGE